MLLTDLANANSPVGAGMPQGALSSLAGAVPKPGFFQSGGTGQGIAHGLGRALFALGGGDLQGMDFQKEDQKNKLLLLQAQLAKAMRPAAGPAAQQELVSAGVQPGTPEYKEAILAHLRPPQYMTLGNAENGQNIVQVGGIPSANGGLPHVSDQAGYDSVPKGSQYVTPDGQIRVKS